MAGALRPGGRPASKEHASFVTSCAQCNLRPRRPAPHWAEPCTTLLNCCRHIGQKHIEEGGRRMKRLIQLPVGRIGTCPSNAAAVRSARLPRLDSARPPPSLPPPTTFRSFWSELARINECDCQHLRSSPAFTARYPPVIGTVQWTTKVLTPVSVFSWKQGSRLLWPTVGLDGYTYWVFSWKFSRWKWSLRNMYCQLQRYCSLPFFSYLFKLGTERDTTREHKINSTDFCSF